jgi:prepilin signal peptidase PulO-like enzyme (type II secretory pathway)
MLEIVALLCIVFGLGLLILLSIIDLKTYLLPNIYVAPFAALGVIFHISTDFIYVSVHEMIFGGIVGYGILYLIRMAGNKYYGQDSLGLGDVKLLGAGGLWLGPEGILFAMTLGAMAGLIHGIIHACFIYFFKKQPFSLRRLAIPAGPGFALGIILVAAWMLKGFVMGNFYELIS